MSTLLNLPPIDKGADYHHRLTWKDSGGTPVNLTGYSAQFLLTEKGYLAVSNTPILGGVSGTIDITIDHTTTTNLKFSKAEYKILLTSPSGDIIPFCRGLVLVE